MTTDPRDQKTDQDIEQDLEALRSALSGTDMAEPPHLLDQAVLNVARREVLQHKAHWSKHLPLRWLGAFATATVVVLAFTVVIEQDQQAPVPVEREADGLKLDRDEATPAKRELRKDAYKARSAAPVALEEQKVKESVVLQEAEEAAPDAESWIERLVQLKESQQQDLLEEELAAFRKAFPDYPLPPELDN